VKKRILFLCTGNAARSQMAEALARLDHRDAVDVVSAGSRPSGGVHPDAVVVLAEIGSDIAGARSKSAAEYRDQRFDAVITVCDAAARDCPTWPGAKRILHWSIEDPSFEPDPTTRIERFRQTRDDLRGRIAAFVPELRRESTRRALRGREEPRRRQRSPPRGKRRLKTPPVGR
jgi:arsenate reductase